MPTHLTPRELVARQDRAWRAWSLWHPIEVQAFFPDITGRLHLLHNWYRGAAATDPEAAKLADWVHDSVWARLRSTSERLEARINRNEHLINRGVAFQPLWCPFCRVKESEVVS